MKISSAEVIARTRPPNWRRIQRQASVVSDGSDAVWMAWPRTRSRVGGQVHDVGLELHHQAGAERVEAFRVAQGEDGPGLVAFDVHEAALVAGTLAEQSV
jgi:hypothetical protein